MDYFKFNESTQELKILGCKGAFAGRMDYKIDGPGGIFMSNTNNSGTPYTTSAIAPGNYTATVECEYTSNPDSHTICLKYNPQGGGLTHCDTRIPDDRGPSEPTDPNLGAKIEPIEPIEPINIEPIKERFQQLANIKK